jgi:hypothetical protein
MRGGPEMEMHVKKKRIGEGNTNYGDRISQSQEIRPCVEAEIKKPVQRYEQIA